MPQFRWSQLFTAVFLGVLGATLAWHLLVQLFPVILIAVTGFVLAYLLDPLLRWMEHRGWSRGQAVATVALVIVAVLAAAGILIVPTLVDQVTSVAQSLPTEISKLTAPGSDALTWVQQHFPAYQSPAYLQDQLQTAETWLSAKLPDVGRWASRTLLTSFRGAGVLAITLFIAVWFMVVLEPFRQHFAALFSHEEAEQLRVMDREISHMLGQYLRGMALTCLGIAAGNAVLLTVVGRVCGTKYGLLIAALAGIAYLVPYLGMLTVVVVAGALSYVTSNGSWLAVALTIGSVVVVNQIFDALVMPRIVGRKVGLHPLAIILALLAGGALGGIGGMILATPIAAAIKIILAHWVPVIATPTPTEGPAPRQPAPLNLDLSRFAAQTWQAVRGAGAHVERAGHRLEAIARGPAPGTSEKPHHETTKESKDDDSGTSTELH
jgi:predicted PurR-regulated permease PerM